MRMSESSTRVWGKIISLGFANDKGRLGVGSLSSRLLEGTCLPASASCWRLSAPASQGLADAALPRIRAV